MKVHIEKFEQVLVLNPFDKESLGKTKARINKL
jgi:hypothetical protein